MRSNSEKRIELVAVIVAILGLFPAVIGLINLISEPIMQWSVKDWSIFSLSVAYSVFSLMFLFRYGIQVGSYEGGKTYRAWSLFIAALFIVVLISFILEPNEVPPLTDPVIPEPTGHLICAGPLIGPEGLERANFMTCIDKYRCQAAYALLSEFERGATLKDTVLQSVVDSLRSVCDTDPVPLFDLAGRMKSEQTRKVELYFLKNWLCNSTDRNPLEVWPEIKNVLIRNYLAARCN